MRQDRLLVVESLALESHKTRNLASRLRALKLESALLVTDKMDRNLALAVRNIPGVDALEARELDPVSLIHFDKVIATQAALAQLEARLK